MDSFKNSSVLFLMAGAVALFVTVQALVFFVRAWKQGKRLGISTSVMRRTAVSSGVFSLVPSISIILGIITLSGALGVALPWFRECVIGAITYELPAAETAAQAFGDGLKAGVDDPVVFSAIAWVMTLGSLVPLILIPIFLKRIQGGVASLQSKNSRWTDLLLAAMFIGMISAFLGQSFSGGPVAVLTLLSSAVIMGILGFLVKKRQIKWLEDFALPITMLGGMALAVLYNAVL